MELLSNNQKSLFGDMKNVLFQESTPKYKHRLKMNLQHFAEGDDEGDDSDDDNDGDDSTDDEDELSLDELLKDPKFKKQYQKKMKEQLGKRLKKYEGIDPEEVRRLKEQAEKKKKKDQDDEEDEVENLKGELSEKDKKLQRAERKEKKLAVKEFAIDNGYDHKLLSRLVDLDEVEMDEDGNPENLDELFEDIQSEFSQYFPDGTEDDEEDEEDEYTQRRKKLKSTYQAGSKQKGNKKKKVDPRLRGAERAKARHKKEE
jgi:hypothetical protein